jgi:hypothetical protein
MKASYLFLVSERRLRKTLLLTSGGNRGLTLDWRLSVLEGPGSGKA